MEGNFPSLGTFKNYFTLPERVGGVGVMGFVSICDIGEGLTQNVGSSIGNIKYE